MAGYSKRTLIDKLGIKSGMRVALLAAPPNYAVLLRSMPADVSVKTRLPSGRNAEASLDFIQIFTTSRAALAAKMPALKRSLAMDGMLWISWPKKSAADRLAADLGENDVRAIALAHGLVDVKVAAIDDIWSGLKLVYRLRDRK